jgi:hypothetical protein
LLPIREFHAAFFENVLYEKDTYVRTYSLLGSNPRDCGQDLAVSKNEIEGIILSSTSVRILLSDDDAVDAMIVAPHL